MFNTAPWGRKVRIKPNVELPLLAYGLEYRKEPSRMTARILLLLTLMLAPSLTAAVLIATGTANDVAPPDDPGWAHLGTRTGTNDNGFPLNGLTLIYVGNGWVLTANHVKESDLKLGGVVYPRISGSKVRFKNDDLSDADLMAYQIVGNPDLPNLPIMEIADTSPPIGAEVVMIGRGNNRGNATTWQQPGGPLRVGWLWANTAKMRWGTNLIADPVIASPSATTDSFVTDFTRPGESDFTSEEAQVVVGDSGGAVFYKVGPEWQLAGVVHSAVQYAGQNPASSLDGNVSYAADLAGFRDQIIAVVRPECSDEIDNDGDGLIDYPQDAECFSAAASSEAPHVPGLSSFGLGVLIAGMTGSVVLAQRRSALASH